MKELWSLGAWARPGKGAMAAVVCRQAKRQPPRGALGWLGDPPAAHARKLRPGRRWGFTLIELLTVVAIITLLLAILVPSLRRARELTRRMLCASNARQLAVSCQMYAQKNKQKVPVSPGLSNASLTWYNWHSWGDNKPPIQKGWVHFGLLCSGSYVPYEVMFCPSNNYWPHTPEGWGNDGVDPAADTTGWGVYGRAKRSCGYLYGPFGEMRRAPTYQRPTVASYRDLATYPLALDIFLGDARPGYQDSPIWVHQGGLNASFGDGAVRFIPVTDDIVELSAQVGADASMTISTMDDKDYFAFCMREYVRGNTQYMEAFPYLPP